MISMRTKQKILESKPVRLQQWEVDETTKLVVIYKPKFENAIARKSLLPFFRNKYFTIKLDALGSEVWKHCDGEQTVRQLGIILAKKFGPEIEPIYDRLIQFMVELQRGKFVRLVDSQ